MGKKNGYEVSDHGFKSQCREVDFARSLSEFVVSKGKTRTDWAHNQPSFCLFLLPLTSLWLSPSYMSREHSLNDWLHWVMTGSLSFSLSPLLSADYNFTHITGFLPWLIDHINKKRKRFLNCIRSTVFVA